MNRQFFQLLSVQLKEFIREPGIIFWGILFPVLMAWGLGLAFSEKGQLIQTVALVNEVTAETDTTWLSIGNKLLGETRYRIIPSSWDKAVLMMKRGQADLIISRSGDSTRYHFDPANPEAQLAYLHFTAAEAGNSSLGSSGNILPMKQTGTRYIDFLIPGLLTMGVMMSCMWGISYGMIDKRSKKLLRRMVATPMRRSEFLTAVFMGRMLLNFVEAGVLLAFAALMFDIEIQGSVAALILVFIAGNVAFSGMAVLTSSRTSSTEVGNGLINAVVMPMMILSGIFFSYHNFPVWAVKIIQLFPLTMFADITRSIFNEGFGLAEALVPTAVLSTLGVITFAVGLKIYKWY